MRQTILPAVVTVGFRVRKGGVVTEPGAATTDAPLFPGQVKVLGYSAIAGDKVTHKDTFEAKRLVDPQNLLFHECRDDDDVSAKFKPDCQSVR